MTMSMTSNIIDCFPCMDAHAHACASSYIDRHHVILLLFVHCMLLVGQKLLTNAGKIFKIFDNSFLPAR